MNEEKRFYSIIELSEYLGVKTKTIRDWVYQKRIPYTKVGRLLRFDTELINKWLASSTIIPNDMQKCYNKNQVEGREINI